MGKKVILKKAKKLELKGSQKKKINPERIPALEELLHNVYVFCRPKPIDYHNRKDIVRIFNEISKEIYGNSDDIPIVEAFGSFLMDIFTAKSDLDLSVNFSKKAVDFPRENKIRSLRKFAKKLYALQRKGHVSTVQPILTAKVPILKVVDRGTGIECDISIENRDGIVKSQIVRVLSLIDERFQMLSFLMKAWAKAHDINSSKERTLNSLSILSLVAFHLQTRDPPILPPLSAIFKDGTDPAPVGKIVNMLLNYGKRNKESLGELFVTLLIKLASVEKLWPKGLCASVYDGSWIFKTWDSKFGCLSVEDFTDRSQNVARAVGTKEVKRIYKWIHLSIGYVVAFMDGQIKGTKLREFLFGRESIPVVVETNKRTEGENNTVKTKIVRWGGTPTKGWGDTPAEEEGLGGKQPSIQADQIQPKRMQSTVERWGGTAGVESSTAKFDKRTTDSPTSLDPIQTKKKRHTGGWRQTEAAVPSSTVKSKTVHWGGPPTKGWGGTPAEGEDWGGKLLSLQADPIQPKIMQSTVEGWGGTTRVERSTAKFDKRTSDSPTSLDPIQTKKMRHTGGWGETELAAPSNSVKSKTLHWGGTPTKGWGGTPAEGEGWGGKLLSLQADQIQPKRMQSTVEGWGGTALVESSTTKFDKRIANSHTSLHPIQTKMMRPAGWWGKTEVAIPSNTLKTKTVHWGGTPTKGWGGTAAEGEGWGGKQLSIQADQIQPK